MCHAIVAHPFLLYSDCLKREGGKKGIQEKQNMPNKDLERR